MKKRRVETAKATPVQVVLSAEDFYRFVRGFESVDLARLQAEQVLREIAEKRDRLYASLVEKYHLPPVPESVRWDEDQHKIEITPKVTP